MAIPRPRRQPNPGAGLGTLSGLVVGLVNGIIITRLRIDAFIATLAMLNVVRGIVYIISNQYNVNIPDGSAFLFSGAATSPDAELGPDLPRPVCGVFDRWSGARRSARSIHALGGNEAAAHLCGISLAGIRTATYAISGACAALAGVIITSQVASRCPTRASAMSSM